MKKIEYQAPEMEVIMIETQTTLLTISDPTPGKGDEINTDPE